MRSFAASIWNIVLYVRDKKDDYDTCFNMKHKMESYKAIYISVQDNVQNTLITILNAVLTYRNKPGAIIICMYI